MYSVCVFCGTGAGNDPRYAEATRGMTSNELMAQALEHPLTNILPMPEGH